MEKIGNTILAGTLAFSTPQVVNSNNIEIKKIKIDVKQQTIDALNIELILNLNEIYKIKSEKVKDFLYNYYQYTGEYLAKMSEKNFIKLVGMIYDINNENIRNIRNSKKFKSIDVDYILNKNIEEVEQYFDNIFGFMISQGESERALLYMGYLKNTFGYKIDNFVKKYFLFDYIPDGVIKKNLNKFINKLDNEKNKKIKKEFIENLSSKDFFEDNYELLDDYTKGIIDMYILVIKTKLKELYFN